MLNKSEHPISNPPRRKFPTRHGGNVQYPFSGIQLRRRKPSRECADEVCALAVTLRVRHSLGDDGSPHSGECFRIRNKPIKKNKLQISFSRLHSKIRFLPPKFHILISALLLPLFSKFYFLNLISAIPLAFPSSVGYFRHGGFDIGYSSDLNPYLLPPPPCPPPPW